MQRQSRVAVGQLAQETNSFVPFRTTLDHFARRCLRRGGAVLDGWDGERTEVPGILSVLRAAGVEAVPLLCAAADSGGPVTVEAFEALLGGLVDALQAAGPVDGVVLALHGAMVLDGSDWWDDPEAEVLRRVRAVLPPGTPVVASLDLHAHVTPALLQHGVALVGYHEYPHTDMFETGERAARLLLDTLAGRRRPVMALAKRPMVPSPVCARTPDPPLSHLAAQARAAEAAGLLDVSLFPVQPWIDVPGLGFAVLACADGDAALAQRTADALADAAWAGREGYVTGLVPLDEAIQAGLAHPGMTLVGDVGDSPTGGAAADQPAVLRALLAAEAERHGRPILLTLCDPAAAAAALRAGAGAEVALSVGHAFTPGQPLPLRARVERLHDGRFIARDAGATGSVVDHGPTAVLAIGAIRVVVRSTPGREWDTGIFTSAGLDPAAASLVFVKSPGHFRVAFGPLAARTLLADTPGPTCGNTALVPWTRTGPLWPRDPEAVPGNGRDLHPAQRPGMLQPLRPTPVTP